MPLLPRPGALLLLALCLAPTRALGQVGEEERVFTGHVYTADGATADGVVVSVRGGMGADSLRVDSTGAFTHRLPGFPATPVRLAARADGADDRYYPLLLRIGASQRGDGLALILIPRQWTPAAGRYAGVPVAVDPVAATAATCRTGKLLAPIENRDQCRGRPMTDAPNDVLQTASRRRRRRI
jgi:hypothetical protein